MTDLAKRLHALDTCALADALDARGWSGAVTGLSPIWAGAQLAGRVITMTVIPARGKRAARHLGAAAIDQAQSGDVVVVKQELDPSIVSASWGGLLARAAHLRGLAGVVIDGNCRDVDEIRELGLPVLARAAVPFTARRRYVESAVGEPVQIQGVTVSSGDWVRADGSGVVFLEADRAEAVVGTAEGIVARESAMITALTAGAPLSEVLGAAYEELLDV